MSVHELSLKRWARTIRAATVYRDECIRALWAEGRGVGEIADLAGMTPEAVAEVLADPDT